MQLSSNLSTRLHYQHKTLVDLIDGLSDEQIRKEIIPGKWSIFQNIVHLQTYQYVFLDRIKTMLKETNPIFPRYSADNDSAFKDNCNKSSREIMADMIKTRKEMVSGHLGINENDFSRTGTHPVFGRMTIENWLNFFLLHEAHHLFTIFKLAAEVKKQ